MTKKIKLVDPSLEEKPLNLHPEILAILFENRRLIKNAFLEVKGLYDIAYMGITIINPERQVLVFSSIPSIEYNLIHQNLWQKDPCFAPSKQTDVFCWWNTQVDTIDLLKTQKIKLQNNQFTQGMTVTRELNNFYLLYSYATGSEKQGLRDYYQTNIFGLLDIGDYFYKTIRELYSIYDLNYTSPQINHLAKKISNMKCNTKLRLVTNDEHI